MAGSWWIYVPSRFDGEPGSYRHVAFSTRLVPRDWPEVKWGFATVEGLAENPPRVIGRYPSAKAAMAAFDSILGIEPPPENANPEELLLHAERLLRDHPELSDGQAP
jgi:hypothetical protein